MSGLKEFSSKIKKIYDSDSDNIPDILNSLLGEADRYSRIGSYFSSKSFVSLAEGLSEFIFKNGKMRLIINYELEKEDYNEIKKAIKSKKIEKEIILSIKNLKAEIELNSAKVLGWLIANKRLEIRVVIGKTSKLLHIKQGIIEDPYGNKVAFSGSANETYAAYSRNIEEVAFFKSWEQGQEGYVDKFIQKFGIFWNNEGHDARTYTIAKAIEEELIKIRPRNEEELKKICFKISNIKAKKDSKEKKRPRPYQKDAIEEWLSNRKRGIIEMPTACGKTKTALFCYREVKKESPIITVIFSPTRTICNQWVEELEPEAEKICEIFDNPGWKSELKKDILDVRLKARTDVVIVGTYALMNSEYLIEQIRSLKNTKKFLIADEVHSTGAAKTSDGLIEDYDFRLGLSATPKRWLDDEGTEKILGYFNGIVYDKLTLFDAIYRLRALSKYKYYLIHVMLNDDELNKYEELTRKFSKMYAQRKRENPNPLADKDMRRILEKRAEIIKNCEAKIDEFKKLAEKISLEKSIVFVSPKQREKVNEILLKKTTYHQYTYSEKSEKMRSEIIENFKMGKISCIVAIKCLDEGLDIPSVRTGIILASSGNPREFIQRRGRLLRKDTSKEYAEVYDFFVTPPIETIRHIDAYKSQINKELQRILEFSKSAENEREIIEHLNKLKNKLGI